MTHGEQNATAGQSRDANSLARQQRPANVTLAAASDAQRSWELVGVVSSLIAEIAGVDEREQSAVRAEFVPPPLRDLADIAAAYWVASKAMTRRAEHSSAWDEIRRQQAQAVEFGDMFAAVMREVEMHPSLMQTALVRSDGGPINPLTAKSLAASFVSLSLPAHQQRQFIDEASEVIAKEVNSPYVSQEQSRSDAFTWVLSTASGLEAGRWAYAVPSIEERRRFDESPLVSLVMDPSRSNLDRLRAEGDGRIADVDADAPGRKPRSLTRAARNEVSPLALDLQLPNLGRFTGPGGPTPPSGSPLVGD